MRPPETHLVDTDVVTLSRIAAIFSSGARAHDRALEAIDELHRTIPFEAALLSFVHPVSGVLRPLVTVGYPERVSERLMSAAFHEEFIDRFDMLTTGWPLRECDLPIDSKTLPSISEYLTPAGLVEGIVCPLIDDTGKYNGCLFLSTADERHPDDAARRILGQLAPAFHNLIDQRQTMRRLASTLDAHWSTIGLGADGAVVNLGDGEDARALDPDGALVRELGGRVRDRQPIPGRFVWPADEGRGWLAVRVERSRLEGGPDGAEQGVVVAARAVDIDQGVTKREVEVLAGLVAGESNAVMADRLGVAPSTIKAHVEHILEKLGLPTRAAAAAFAAREGLVPLPPRGSAPLG